MLHCADLHLDRPLSGLAHLPGRLAENVRESTFRSFARIVEEAIRREVDFIVVVGDLYDGEDRSLKAQVHFRKQVERLARHGISVYALFGNHDHLAGDWPRIDWPENIYFFGPEVETVLYKKRGEAVAALTGFSYPQRNVRENRVQQYRSDKKAPYRIALLHGYLQGSKGHAAYAPFTIADLKNSHFDYWALGHIHQRRVLLENPPAVYPGNIQGLYPKESGEKGCYYVEFSGRQKVKYHFIATNDVEWREIRVEITGMDHFGDLLTVCQKKMAAWRKKGKTVLATIVLTGSGKLHHELTESRREELLALLQHDEEDSEFPVWPHALNVRTDGGWQRETLKNEDHFLGDLIRLSESHPDLSSALQPLLTHQKAKKYLQPFDDEEQRRIVREAENLLLGKLLKE